MFKGFFTKNDWLSFCLGQNEVANWGHCLNGVAVRWSSTVCTVIVINYEEPHT